MALIAYNLTAAPLVLAAGNPVPTLKASASVGVRSQGYDVTVELLGITAANYAALQAQQNTLSKVAVAGSFAVAGPNVTMTDTTGAFIANNVGQFITIAGAISAANNGLFLVTAQTATTITFTNAAGVAEAYTGTYSLPGLVQYEWTDLPEYNTFTLVAGSAQEDIVHIDQEIYVDGATGNDANPGTSALPVQTFDAGFNKMQAGRKKRRIYVKAGTYTLDTAGQLTKEYFFPAPVGTVGLDAEPVVIIGDNVTVETGLIGAIVSGSRIFTRNTPAAPQVGGALLITNGAAAGRRLLIAFDDGTTITLLDQVGAGLVAGTTTFTIERPATIFNLTDGLISFTGAPFALKNLKFTGTFTANGRTFRIGDQGNCRAVENVDFDTDKLNVVAANQSILRTASDDNGFLSPNPFSRALRRTCGLYAHGVAFALTAASKSIIGQAVSGGIVLNDSGIVLDNDSLLLANGPPPSGTKAAFLVDQGSFIFFDGQNAVRGIFEDSTAVGFAVVIIGTPSTGSGSAGGRGQIRRITINNSRGDGIKINQQSVCTIDQVNGANNAGYGVNVGGMSSALSMTTTPGAALGNTNCTVTGNNGVVLSSALTLALTAVAVAVDALTAGFPASGVIKIDNELISYSGVSGVQFTGCVRGTNNTIAASHPLGALASQASGADTIIGSTPKQYGAINGTPAFAELFAGMPTGNAFGIRQS